MDSAQQSRIIGLAIGAIGPVAMAGALVGVRDHIVNANVALILVIVVVGAASTGGWQAGAVAAVMSAVSFEFFHTLPYLRLTIASGDDVETTLLLLVVGVSVGFLASRARAARVAASTGRVELHQIHRMAELAASGVPAADVLVAGQDELRELLDLQVCRFEAPPFGLPLARIERNGVVTGVSERRFSHGEFELPRQGAELPVLARGQQIGRFVLEPKPGIGVSLEQRVVAVAIADQVGAALSVPRGEGTSNG